MRRDTPSTNAAAVHTGSPAENLFFSQYRHWMAGYATGDIFYWDNAWDSLLSFVPRELAASLYSDFHLFSRALTHEAGRVPGWRPNVCRCLCIDEFLALLLVAASQRGDAIDECKAAAALIGGDHHQSVVMASRRLAGTLERTCFILAPTPQRSIQIEMQGGDRRTMH